MEYKEFWHQSKDQEFVHKLDLRCPSRTIPIVFHADGVKVYKTQKIWVYSYSSLLKKKGSSLQNKIVLLVVRESLLAKPHTHDAIARLVGWVCTILQTGCFPDKDFSGQSWPVGSRESENAGKPFARENWCASFAAFKGDLEARVMIHKLIRNYMGNMICEHCPAGKLLSYKDFRKTAPWSDVRFTHQEFLDLNPPHRQSMWTCVPGWTKDRNLEDLLHTLHQGVACCVIAALVTDHLQKKFPDMTLPALETQLMKAYTHYKAWCKKERIPGSSLRFNLNRLGRDTWGSLPELSSQYKATTVKYMQYWVHAYLMDEGGATPGSQDRRNCSYSLVMFQKTLDTTEAWFKTDSDATAAAHFGFTMLLFYQRLAKASRQESKANYKVIPKHHYFFHLLEYVAATRRNPRPLATKKYILKLNEKTLNLPYKPKPKHT